MSDLIGPMIGLGVALSLFGAAFAWITISHAREDQRKFPNFYRWKRGLAPPPENYWGYHKYLKWHFDTLAKPRSGKIEEAAMQRWVDFLQAEFESERLRTNIALIQLFEEVADGYSYELKRAARDRWVALEESKCDRST